MELNREQIIKALECCSSREEDTCDYCPLTEISIDCGRILHSISLSLIEELTEENERLRGCVMSEEEVMDIANEATKQCTLIIKADTVREMKERIIENACSINMVNSEGQVIKTDYQISADRLDQIAKEMIEGENNGIQRHNRNDAE